MDKEEMENVGNKLAWENSRQITASERFGYRMDKEEMENVGNKLAWENSRHFATLPLVSQRNDVWETSEEIPYWWRFTTQIWVGFLIGWSKFPTRQDQSVALNRSGWWCVISMEFLRSFLRRHFARKPVVAVASQNFHCFLRLPRSSFLKCTLVQIKGTCYEVSGK